LVIKFVLDIRRENFIYKATRKASSQSHFHNKNIITTLYRRCYKLSFTQLDTSGAIVMTFDTSHPPIKRSNDNDNDNDNSNNKSSMIHVRIEYSTSGWLILARVAKKLHTQRQIVERLSNAVASQPIDRSIGRSVSQPVRWWGKTDSRTSHTPSSCNNRQRGCRAIEATSRVANEGKS
jgi:hypothetical protein